MDNSDNIEIIHPEDPRILLGNYQFTDAFFNLDETTIPPVINSYKAPAEQINFDLKKFADMLLIGHINARSVPKHISELADLFFATLLDIICVSETFIKTYTPKKLCKIKGFKFLRKDRTGKMGGGVGIFIKECFNPKVVKLPQNFSQPETLFIELTVKNTKVVVGVIYKPPKIPYGAFATIQETLAYITTKYEHVIITGDFNINMLAPESYPTVFFQMNVTEPFGLSQMVKDPTRITSTSSTLIDLMLVKHSEHVKHCGVVDIPGISDHCCVYMAYSIYKPKFKPKTITKRDFSKFSQEAFLDDIRSAPFQQIYAVNEENVNDQATIFENVFSSVLDSHAPFKTFTVRHQKSPWLTDHIKKQMNQRDKYKNYLNSLKRKLDSAFEGSAEHSLLKKQLQSADENFKTLRNHVNRLVRDAKIKTFNSEVNDKLNFAKQYHNALKRHNVVDSKFSDNNCNLDPNSLNEAFTSYNNAEVDDQLVNQEINKVLENCKPPTFKFRTVTELEVKKNVKSIKSNACGVDDISAHYLKLSIDSIVPFVTDIVNASFKHRSFPDRWKQAIIKPIPKNDDPSSPADFRPISLLPAISKIIEKIASSQMCDFLKDDDQLDKLQSAYKLFHSTNTALLNITDDIYKALDKSQLTILILLDYSKAFDCANHRLILSKLKAAGFHDDALTWVLSYLLERKQKVRTDLGESRWVTMKNGVPQGSILGPLLFLILVSDLYKSISNGKYHMYADDTQLYYHCTLNQIETTISRINQDLEKVQLFSNNNCLKLNTTKSNFIIIGSRPNLTKLSKKKLPLIVLNNKVIERKTHVKNLGVIFDEPFTWSKHVNKSICTAYYKLRQVYRFKNFLSEDSKKSVCESYILCHFNYCDSVYFNITEFLKSKIQKVQNTCFRFIFGLKKYDHVSSCLVKLDTLNMHERRLLHGLSLMHKINRKIAPVYLIDRIVRNEDIHSYNTRHRSNIVSVRCNTAMRKNSFFPFFSKMYNEITSTAKLRDASVITFKKHVKEFLKNIRHI